MHSSSHTWVNPKYRENEKTRMLKAARRKFCPKSTIWTEDFDLAKHKQEWAAGQARYLKAQKKARNPKHAASENWRNPSPLSLTRPPFDKKSFSTNHSWVLCMETIFSPSWEKGKLNIAPWPSKSEMKYEGDDRISTDKLHRRFLGLPRLEGNDTVNWQHRAPIAQFWFDDFYYPLPSECDIFFRSHWVAESEFDDEEGRKILGGELLRLLDPKDQW